MAAPFDNLIDVLNTARVRLNDNLTTLQPISGKLLENNSVFSLKLVNNAWRRLQEALANLGYTAVRQELILTGVPALPSTQTDPASQCSLDFTGYNNTATVNTGFKLPVDFMTPLKLWERQTGTLSAFVPMENMVDGLPSWPKQVLNGIWEWRADAIYLPGATISIDLRIRYNRYLADFADTSTVQWFVAVVPILRALDAFAYFICAEVADSREDLDGDEFRLKGEAAAALMCNRDIAMKERTNVRRRSRSGRLEGNSW